MINSFGSLVFLLEGEYKWVLKIHSNKSRYSNEVYFCTYLQGQLPVPKIISVCEDDQIIGSPFMIMEYVDGVVFRVPPREYSNTLIGVLNREQVRKIYQEALIFIQKCSTVTLDRVLISNRELIDQQLNLKIKRMKPLTDLLKNEKD